MSIRINLVELGVTHEPVILDGTNPVTVAEALEAAGVDSFDVKIGGEPVLMSDMVDNGDYIFIGGRKIKGNVDDDFVKVSFVLIGSTTAPVFVAPGTTVSAAADQAGISIDGFDVKNITASGVVLGGSDTINASSTLMVTKKIKGNAEDDFVKVSFVLIGSTTSPVFVEPGTTVSAAADQAGISIDGFDVKNITASGVVLNGSDSINSSSTLMVTKKIKGNN